MINFIKRLISKFNIATRGVCSICDQEFDDNELSLHNNLFLCPDDEKHFLSHEWYLLAEAFSDPENPQAALNLQNRKDKLKTKNIKSYIQTAYFEDEGQIITKFSLYREVES